MLCTKATRDVPTLAETTRVRERLCTETRDDSSSSPETVCFQSDSLSSFFVFACFVHVFCIYVLRSFLFLQAVFAAFGLQGYLLVCLYFILGSARDKELNSSKKKARRKQTVVEETLVPCGVPGCWGAFACARVGVSAIRFHFASWLCRVILS